MPLGAVLLSGLRRDPPVAPARSWSQFPGPGDGTRRISGAAASAAPACRSTRGEAARTCFTQTAKASPPPSSEHGEGPITESPRGSRVPPAGGRSRSVSWGSARSIGKAGWRHPPRNKVRAFPSTKTQRKRPPLAPPRSSQFWEQHFPAPFLIARASLSPWHVLPLRLPSAKPCPSSSDPL